MIKSHPRWPTSNLEVVMLVGDSTNHVHLIRLRPDLPLDGNFHQARMKMLPFHDGISIREVPTVFEITVLPDGRIMVGGTFDRVDGSWRKGICVFLADGTVDPSVETGRGAESDSIYGTVTRLVPRGSGTVLASGTLRGFDFDERPLLVNLILGTDGPIGRLSLLTAPQAPPRLWGFLPKGMTGHVQESTNLVDWRTIHTAPAPELHVSLTNASDAGSFTGTSITNIHRPHPNVFYRLLMEAE